MEKICLAEKFALIREHWRPKVVGELNGQEVKLVKFRGTFVWHHHEREDELFLGVRGRFRIELRDRAVDSRYKRPNRHNLRSRTPALRLSTPRFDGLPFCAPVSIPGLSTPLGLVIAFTAARYFLGLPPHLPRRLLDTELPPRFFRVLLAGVSKVIGFIERALQPRLLALTATPRRVRVHAGLVFTGAVILLIPAPIALSNTLPALAVLLGTTGVMERDGVAILTGYVFAGLGAAYFVLIAFMGTQAYDLVVQKLSAG